MCCFFKPDMTFVFIYGLCDPRDGCLRYIGKANNPTIRLYRHHCPGNKKNHRTDWLNSLKKSGLKPEMFIVEQIPASEWEEAERFWICYFKTIGCKLVNSTGGGDGVSMVTEETRAKLRTIALARGPHSEETKAKMSLAHKGAQHRLGRKGKKPHPGFSVETRERMSLSHKGKPWSDARRMAQKGSLTTPANSVTVRL